MLSSTTTTSAVTCVGRIAVVTGANKGIGYFIALQLALSGLFQHVLLGCRDATRAQQAVQSIQDHLVQTSQGKKSSATTISWAPLTLGDVESHEAFVKHLRETFNNRIDVLVNNAAFAYKNSDPTPFQKQCKPTLDVNFYGTIDLTNHLIPLLQNGHDARVVTVASRSGRLSQLSSSLQQYVSSDSFTFPQLLQFMQDFQASVLDGSHRSKGYGNSNYGMSKLGVIAATRIWAREHESIQFFACCPGYCQTDMTSQQGTRDPADGARNAVIPVTLPSNGLPPSGSFFSDYQVSEW